MLFVISNTTNCCSSTFATTCTCVGWHWCLMCILTLSFPRSSYFLSLVSQNKVISRKIRVKSFLAPLFKYSPRLRGVVHDEQGLSPKYRVYWTIYCVRDMRLSSCHISCYWVMSHMQHSKPTRPLSRIQYTGLPSPSVYVTWGSRHVIYLVMESWVMCDIQHQQGLLPEYSIQDFRVILCM